MENTTTKLPGQRVGYVRVSSDDQNTARQLDGIQLDRTFTEHASGRDTNRPQLQLMLEYVRWGDTVIVHSLDRLARNLLDLKQLVCQMTDKGVSVQFLKENMTFEKTGNPMNNLLLSILGGFAEFEREMILERQREGIRLAKKEGKYKGRAKTIRGDKTTEVDNLYAQGMPISAIARRVGASRQTIYSYLNKNNSYAKNNEKKTT